MIDRDPFRNRQVSGSIKLNLPYAAGRSWTALALLSGALVYMLFFQGGVYPLSRSIPSVMIAMAAIVLPFTLQGSNQTKKNMTRTLAFINVRTCCILLFAGLCFQLVSLPLPLMQIISPMRAEAMRSVAQIRPGYSWAPISVKPARSLLELMTALDCLLVCLCIRQLAKIHGGLLLSIPILLAGMAEAILGVAQNSDPDGPATATGTFLNRNHLAGFLDLLIPFLIVGGVAILRDRRLSAALRLTISFLLLTCASLFAAAVLETYSRMGLAVILLIVTMTPSLFYLPQIRFSVRSTTVALALLGITVTITIALAPSRLLQRFQHASSIDQDSTTLRIGFWRDSLPLLADYALTGSGLGTFESVFPRYQKTGSEYRVEYLHNDYLQTAIELGLPWFAIGLLVLGSLIRRLLLPISPKAPLWTRCLGVGCLTSVAGILLHSAVDFNLQIPANSLTCAWIIGIGLSLQVEAKSEHFDDDFVC